jgi:lipopolysaccharide export system protein LptC
VNRVTTVSQIHGRGLRAYQATGRIDGERMFRAALRHSRFVRALRVTIPVGLVVGGAAAIVVATWLDPLRALARLPVNLGGLVVSGTKITMQAPRLAGFTRDQRSYVVVARAAAQDVTNPDLLELQDINATMEVQDGQFKVVARAGLYNNKTEMLTLQQNIVVTSSAYEAYLSEALVNVRTSHIISERPVEVKMQQGTINANRLEVLGDVIRFERGVDMLLVGESQQPERTAGAR